MVGVYLWRLPEVRMSDLSPLTPTAKGSAHTHRPKQDLQGVSVACVCVHVCVRQREATDPRAQPELCLHVQNVPKTCDNVKIERLTLLSCSLDMSVDVEGVCDLKKVCVCVCVSFPLLVYTLSPILFNNQFQSVLANMPILHLRLCHNRTKTASPTSDPSFTFQPAERRPGCMHILVLQLIPSAVVTFNHRH